MKTIGKICLIFIFSLNLFAASVYLEDEKIYKGEYATIIVEATGKKVLFKEVEEINGLEVVSLIRRFLDIEIDGEKQRKYKYFITFYPDKSMQIPPFEIEINGKKEKTQPIFLELDEMEEEPIQVNAFVDKTKVLNNELIKYSLRFKYKKTFEFSDIRLIDPDMENFWIQSKQRVPNLNTKDYIIMGIDYYITPQSPGILTIGKAKVKVEEEIKVFPKDDHSTSLTRPDDVPREFESNSMRIDVKEFTKSNFIGNFKIKTSINKKEMQGTDTLDMVIGISGTGNMSDIEPYEIDLDGVTLLSNDIKIHRFEKGGNPYWKHYQRISLTNPTKSFTIPSFSFNYYDIKTKEVKEINTKVIDILVHNPFIMESFRGGTIENIREEGFILNILNIIIGFVAGISTILLIQYFLSRKTKKKIVLYKNNKEFLFDLMQYKGRSKDIDDLIKKLDDKVYRNIDHNISRKEIRKVKKELSKY